MVISNPEMLDDETEISQIAFFLPSGHKTETVSWETYPTFPTWVEPEDDPGSQP